MEVQPALISIDSFACDTFAVGAPGVVLPPAEAQWPSETEQADSWTEHFVRSLKAQHGRVREFLQAQRDRWRQVAAGYTRQIETLESEVHSLRATCENLRRELAERPVGNAEADELQDVVRRHEMALEDLRELKARNAELERQRKEAPAGRAKTSPGAVNDWEAEKRRILAALEGDDGHDAESVDHRQKVEEIVRRTDQIIAEKNREIAELQLLLANQSNSLGSLAVGAAALDEVLDQDAIIREERARLDQLQKESQEKLRRAEVEIAMERAKLARREAEIDERLRNLDARLAAGESEGDALAPTGRPVRGRWRAQLGLTDDKPPERDRR